MFFDEVKITLGVVGKSESLEERNIRDWWRQDIDEQ